MMLDVLRDDLLASQQQQWQLIGEYLAAYAARRPIRKVAVVGNAPLGPNPDRAVDIDSSDLVIRVNEVALDGPGEPASIGTACHAVILSRSTTMTRWVFHDYRRRAYLIPQAGFVQYHPGDDVGLLLQTTYWPADLGAMPLPNGVVKARVVQALAPDAKPGSIIPTTGTMAVFLGHELFPDAELVATGFSFLENSSQKFWSHHSGSSTKVNWQHRLDLEADLLRSWIDDGSMRFLT
jgi:hypothetical protein